MGYCDRTTRRVQEARVGGVLRQDDASARQNDHLDVPRHVEAPGGEDRLEAAFRMPSEGRLLEVGVGDPEDTSSVSRVTVRVGMGCSVTTLDDDAADAESKNEENDDQPRRGPVVDHGAEVYPERRASGYAQIYEPRQRSWAAQMPQPAVACSGAARGATGTILAASLRADDRPLGRQRHAALAWGLQHFSEMGVAEKTDVGVIERRFRDNKRVPEAGPGIDEEYLGGSVKREEIDTVTVAKLAPEELTDQLQLAFIERGAYPSPVITH